MKDHDCYKCKHRGSVPGDRHSCCLHPRQFELEIQGHPHGIAKGWFIWPLNFDPIWLEACDGFEAKETKETKE